jgi:hypothetical protein
MRNFCILALNILTTCLLSSCAVVGGIFKAGVWTGIILVAAVVALILYLVSRSQNK